MVLYLNIRGGDAVTPGGADPAVIRFSDLGNAAFQVEEISGTQNGSILYFHDTPVTSNGVTNYLNFNRTDGVTFLDVVFPNSLRSLSACLLIASMDLKSGVF